MNKSVDELEKDLGALIAFRQQSENNLDHFSPFNLSNPGNIRVFLHKEIDICN